MGGFRIPVFWPIWSCLIIEVLATQTKFLGLYDQLFLYLSYNKFFWLLPWCYGPVQTYKAKVPELDYIACPSMQLSNYTQSGAMHMLEHQLARYYQPWHIPSMAWSASIPWYTCCKLAYTKILQKFWLTLWFLSIITN